MSDTVDFGHCSKEKMAEREVDKHSFPIVENTTNLRRAFCLVVLGVYLFLAANWLNNAKF